MVYCVWHYVMNAHLDHSQAFTFYNLVQWTCYIQFYLLHFIFGIQRVSLTHCLQFFFLQHYVDGMYIWKVKFWSHNLCLIYYLPHLGNSSVYWLLYIFNILYNEILKLLFEKCYVIFINLYVFICMYICMSLYYVCLYFYICMYCIENLSANCRIFF